MTELRAIAGNVERRGRWTVPERLELRVLAGNMELDFRDAVLRPGVTTIEVSVDAGSLEIEVPPNLAVELEVSSIAGHVEAVDSTPPVLDPAGPVLRITGRVRCGNLEVTRLMPGETKFDARFRRILELKRARRHHRHRRWHDIQAERDMWKRHAKGTGPWWMQARIRRRIFSWLAVALFAGIYIGWRVDTLPWWQIGLGLFGISVMSGMIAWSLTRPLLMVVRAARDIGDGKLDTRLDAGEHGGETHVLATAINDMAAKIQQQIADQRQLLAAVSHELRTPLGHMRVMIETLRDGGNGKAIDGLEKEVLILDDLVGRLLASSRLEFGNLDRRRLDLGTVVTDAATADGVAPEAIEAIGDVHASVDPTLFARAVANLLDNARTHGRGVVAVRIERRAGRVAVEVDDAGPGVPADRRADAFRAFVPSNNGGLGLGLALVSRIAVAHGGGAWIDDRPGGGARVGFSVDATRS
ncbi:MAG: HAMP domain-containing protein [Deltaproteobacteria bacterium]|nr:HAMP domain-containing protein [Deltaproteobacteria bacterium]